MAVPMIAVTTAAAAQLVAHLAAGVTVMRHQMNKKHHLLWRQQQLPPPQQQQQQQQRNGKARQPASKVSLQRKLLQQIRPAAKARAARNASSRAVSSRQQQTAVTATNCRQRM
jgi:exoribonuclease R